MGRPRKQCLFPVALSVDAAADALPVPRRIIDEAISLGELEAFVAPSGRRVRVTVADLTAWICTSWKRATKQTRNDSHAMATRR